MIKSNSYSENSLGNIQNNLKKGIEEINNNKNNNDNISSHKIYVNKKIFTLSKNKIDVLKKKPNIETNTTSNTSTSREKNSINKTPLSPFSLKSPIISNNKLKNNQVNKIRKLNNYFTPKKSKKITYQYSTLIKKKINNKNDIKEINNNKNQTQKNSKESIVKILNFIKKKKGFELSFTSPIQKNKKSNNSSIETSFFKTDCIRNNTEENKIKEEYSNENEDNILITDYCLDSKQFEESDFIKNNNLDSINISNANNTITCNIINNNRNSFKGLNEKDKIYFSSRKSVRNFGINQLMKISYNIEMNDNKIKKKNPIRNFTSFSDQKVLNDTSIKDSNAFSISNFNKTSYMNNSNRMSFCEKKNNLSKNPIKKNISKNKFPISKKTKEKKLEENFHKLNKYENKMIRNKTGIFKIHNNTLLVSNKINTNNNSLNTNRNLQGKIENYILGKELGKGSFALVRLGINKITKQKFAIKIYPKLNLLDLEKRNSVKNEISVLKQLNHENIMKLYEVIDSPKNIYLILEYINGISLSDYIKKCPELRIKEEKCKEIYFQIIKAINYCKSKNIYHRDIKLENILLIEEKKVKLIDFGFSIKCPKNTYQKFLCGTPTYMSPEIINKYQYIPEYSDIWSLGVLLYIMLTGYFPFKANTEEVLCRKINKGNFDLPNFLSDNSCNLIKKMLVFEPSKRISTENILNDDWFL